MRLCITDTQQSQPENVNGPLQCHNRCWTITFIQQSLSNFCTTVVGGPEAETVAGDLGEQGENVWKVFGSNA